MVHRRAFEREARIDVGICAKSFVIELKTPSASTAYKGD
jgi:hypothetical protein